MDPTCRLSVLQLMPAFAENDKVVSKIGAQCRLCYDQYRTAALCLLHLILHLFEWHMITSQLKGLGRFSFP
jgi:hypothetical protein